MNGEMDFMILNNKVKGVQGTVDNIDTKIDSVATKENIQEVKTLIENSGGGDALESTSQEILSKVAEGVEVNFRSPIAIKSFYCDSTGSFSGTGKGTLRIYCADSQYSVVNNLVVDEVNLGSLKTSYSCNHIYFIEFNTGFSFSVTVSYSRAVIAEAVFY